MTPRRYITKVKVERVAASLTRRDRELLNTVARVSVASERQLRQMRGAESASARRLFRMDVARLVELRVLARLERRIGGVRSGSDGYVYALDVVGQRIAQPSRRSYRPPWTPQPMHLRHALAVSQLYVDLSRTTTDDVRLTIFDAEPAAWRFFHGPGGTRLVLKPDAFVVLTGRDYQDRSFIEIDRATESLPRIVDKAKAYVRYFQSGREQERHNVFPLVVWIAPDARRSGRLVEALSRLSADHWRLFAVTADDQAVESLVTGAFAPLTNRKEEIS